MALESATILSELNASNPAGTDSTDRGDDHIRLIKSVLLATFPNIDGAVTATPAQLNAVASLAEDLAAFLPLDGSEPMTGDLNMDGNTVAGLATPTEDSEAATKAYVDAQIAAVLATVETNRQALYPVGSRLILGGSSANPATLLGFGTWSLVSQGRFMIGAGDGYNRGDTGGYAETSLTAQNLPEHTHQVFSGASKPSTSTRLTSTNTALDYAQPSFDGADFRYGIVGDDVEPTVGRTSKTGVGAPFSILPPYEVVNIWQRIS